MLPPAAPRASRDTLSFYAQTLDSELKPHAGAGVVVGRACARAALAGNPSDGFGGKTLSLLVANFSATVTVRPSDRLVFVPHPEYDRGLEFASMGELLLATELNGARAPARARRLRGGRHFHLAPGRARGLRGIGRAGLRGVEGRGRPPERTQDPSLSKPFS